MESDIFTGWLGRITTAHTHIYTHTLYIYICMCIYMHLAYWIYILNCDGTEFADLLELNLCVTCFGLFYNKCIYVYVYVL